MRHTILQLTNVLIPALIFAVCVLAEEITLGDQVLKVELLTQENFEGPVDRWRFDGRGRVWVEDGRLQMSADGFESTAWFTEEIQGNLVIRYQARIVDPVDRDNINLFFLATAADGGDILTVPLTGRYSEYHELPNYIWTFTSGHTRLRRDPGFQLLSEDKQTVPEPNTDYDLAVTIRDGMIRCFINGRQVHAYQDPKPHTKGKLGFRTFRTRLWWDNLRIYKLLD